MIYIFVPLVILIFCMRRSNQLSKEKIEILQEGYALLKSVNELLGGCYDNENFETDEENHPEVEILDKVYTTES